MSENTVNAALRRMDFDTATQITGLGFRAMASGMLAELLHSQQAYTGHHLAHNMPDAHGSGCNRPKFYKDRKEMMQLTCPEIFGPVRI